jgi:hypothetical protein
MSPDVLSTDTVTIRFGEKRVLVSGDQSDDGVYRVRLTVSSQPLLTPKETEASAKLPPTVILEFVNRDGMAPLFEAMQSMIHHKDTNQTWVVVRREPGND